MEELYKKDYIEILNMNEQELKKYTKDELIRTGPYQKERIKS